MGRRATGLASLSGRREGHGMDVAGKVAVITGGASGIGLATARALARRGCHLALVDIEPHALDAAAETLSAEVGVRVEARVCDVSDREAMHALAADLIGAFGRIHVLFNNAGVAVAGPIAEMTHDDWRWVIDVDLWGPIHGVEAFLPPSAIAPKIQKRSSSRFATASATSAHRAAEGFVGQRHPRRVSLDHGHVGPFPARSQLGGQLGVDFKAGQMAGALAQRASREARPRPDF